MLAAVVSTIVGRIIFYYLDITYQPGPRIGAFDQVMAEQGITREPLVENLLDGIHLINSFTCVDALSVELLICIRNCPGIYVEPSLTSVNGCEPRSRSTLHADSHARLQDTVASGDDVLYGINDCGIQRMCQGSDHPLRRAAREVGVGVKSDNKPNSWQYAEIAHFHRETVVFAAQQPVQVK